MARWLPQNAPWWAAALVGALVAVAVAAYLAPRVAAVVPPRPRAPIVLEAVLPRMRSGDVVLVGNTRATSLLHRFMVCSAVSHAALVYVEAEGTPHAVPWVLEVGKASGVTATPLWRWFAPRDGRVVYYRRLVRPHGAPSLAPRLRRFMDAHVGRPYSYAFWHAAAANIAPWLPPLPHGTVAAAATTEALFCSQLVVAAWAAVGDVLNAAQTSHDVLPRDMLSARAYAHVASRKLAFVPHVGLGRVHTLTSVLPPDTCRALAAIAWRHKADSDDDDDDEE